MKLGPVGSGVSSMKPLVQLATTQRSTRYRLTPTLSVDAPQPRLIWVLLTTAAVSPVGAVGACVSGAAGVVALATFEYALTFPAASAARTR